MKCRLPEWTAIAMSVMNASACTFTSGNPTEGSQGGSTEGFTPANAASSSAASSLSPSDATPSNVGAAAAAADSGEAGGGDVSPDSSGILAATAVSAGQGTACALTTSGAVACWDDGSTLTASLATFPSFASGVTALSMGGNVEAGGYPFVCAITAGGGVQCYGSENLYGQLGNGTMTSSTTPVQVTGLTSGVTGLSAGGGYVPAVCAVTGDGSIDCWGENFGQLGNATSAATSDVPLQVPGLPVNITSVSVGGTFACAIAQGGGVWCWGTNADGQLGNGTTATSLTPVQVTGLSAGVISVSCAVEHACALTASGAVECWGLGDHDQNGNGVTASSAVPVSVTGLTSGATAISTNDAASCAITSVGAVQCWGYNGNGQLGDGTGTDSAVPVQVQGLTSGVTAISMGYGFACAVTASGGVWCWGGGYSAVPVHVGGFVQ